MFSPNSPNYSLTRLIHGRGPLYGEALHRFALGSAVALAQRHSAGFAGLDLRPESVEMDERGVASIAVPSVSSGGDAAGDVRDWAGVVIFAAGGAERDVDALPPALRAVVQESRHPDSRVRPTALELVRLLLGQDAAGPGSPDEVLARAAARALPPPPVVPVAEPSPAPARPSWYRPLLIAGTLTLVAALAVAVTVAVLRAGPPAPVPTPGASAATGSPSGSTPEGTIGRERVVAVADSDARKAAARVEKLLGGMGATRALLGDLTNLNCPPKGMLRAHGQRARQLETARGLRLDALPGGTALRDALVEALDKSVKALEQYLLRAPGCPPDGDVYPYNKAARDAKVRFVLRWREVIRWGGPEFAGLGLEQRDADTI